MHAVQPQAPQRNNTPIPDQEPWERTTRSGCTVFWCIVTIMGVIGGVCMLAVGGANLGQTFAERGEKVDEFNRQVRASPFTGALEFNSSTVTVQQQPSYGTAPSVGAVLTSPVRVEGSTRGLTADGAYSSALLATSVHPWYANVSTVQVVLNGVSTTRSITNTKSAINAIHCTDVSCDSGCNDKWDRKCTKESLLRACKVLYNEDATYVGDDKCEHDEKCGSCHYTMYVESVCMVVDQAGSFGDRLSLDHATRSCYYPFTSGAHLYTAIKPTVDAHGVSSSSVAFQFRANNDPFVIMQRVTKGTMHFGGLPESEYKGPVVVMCIGLGLILCFGFGMCCYMACCGGCCAPRRASRRSAVVAPAQDVSPVMQSNAAVVNIPSPGHQQLPMQHQAPMHQPARLEEEEMNPLPAPVQQQQQVYRPEPEAHPVQGVVYRNSNDIDAPPRKGQF